MVGMLDWNPILDRDRLLRRYRGDARARLTALAERFERAKRFEPAGGLEALGAAERATISALACVPVLELGLEWLAGWTAVVVYPAEFVARHEFVDEAGVVHRSERVLTGEAWEAGPLIVSLESIAGEAAGDQAGSLVVHEIAHKLDLLNGAANGMPPLHRAMSRRRWTEVWQTAYELCLDEAQAQLPSPFPDDEPEDPGEFFAIASESFFAAPAALRRRYPELYEELRAFYRQDPAALLPPPGRHGRRHAARRRAR
jgi:Mlc titration factor MtfA (ptsG expression regulator)